MKLIDLTGQTFGRLTVLRRADTRQGQKVLWECLCVCGVAKRVMASELRSGGTKSCGCHRVEATRRRSLKHGQRAAPMYRVWRSMISRCRFPSVDGFHNYGGRGIKVCARWQDFATFLEDMGERPANPEGWTSRKAYWSIDRIDVNGDYEPGNVRWATPSEQNKNTRRAIVA